MNIYVLKRIVIAIISCSLAACAATDAAPEEAAYEAESKGRDCISQSSIRDYQVLDDSNLIVTASVKRKYHIVLRRRAFGLRSTWKIGFRSPTGMICPGSSELIVDDGFSPERIHIAAIRQLSPDDLDELLIRFGKKEADIEQAPATEEIEGAEVEELD